MKRENLERVEESAAPPKPRKSKVAKKMRYHVVELHTTYTMAFNLPPKMYGVQDGCENMLLTADDVETARKFAKKMNRGGR